MTVLGFWFAGGVFIDGWAHNHLDSALETFFTPWHAMLYSGFTVCAIALLAYAWKHRAGRTFFATVPKGYGPSLLGVFIFAIGGGADMVWHIVFGIEKDIEALLSPTHLLLAIGGALMLSGPLRAAWYRRGELGTKISAWLPAALSITFTLSLLAFMTQFAHPVRITAAGVAPGKMLVDWYQARGISGFLLQTMLLTGFVLFAVRRWGGKLPFGFFTLIFGLNTYGMTLMSGEYQLVYGAIVAGLLIDVRLRVLRPSIEKPTSLRVFAFSVPATYMLTYFLTLMLTSTIWWSIHLWAGSIVMAGAGGLLMSYLVLPPRVPETL